jgi:hypothetical protein
MPHENWFDHFRRTFVIRELFLPLVATFVHKNPLGLEKKGRQYTVKRKADHMSGGATRNLSAGIQHVRCAWLVIDEPLLMLALSFRKKVTKSIEIAAKPCGELPPDGTSLSDDRIIDFIHGVISSSGVHTIGGS